MTIGHYNTTPHIKHGSFIFPLDDHCYASILANIIRAKQCIYKHDIKEYYDRDHWTMLLLYYIRALSVLKQTFKESFKHVSLKDYYELMGIYRTKDIRCRGLNICHTTCLKDDIELLEYVIIAATALQTILEHEYTFKPDAVTKLVSYNIEASERYYNENFKKKFTK